jgi:uncharacterized protein YjbI with pentapeptide repeats
MYKLYKYLDNVVGAYKENADGSRIVFTFDNLDNTDYANFKKEVLAGAELQDADGNVMTQAEADAFIATLP